MAYSQNTLIQKVMNLLEVNHDFYDILSASITDTATTMTVPDGDKYSVGDVIEFQPDGEMVRVRDVVTNDLTITRGVFGTTAAAQTANDIIIKNPEVSLQLVKDSILATFHTLWPMAWKTATDDLVPDLDEEWYEVNTSAMDLVGAYQLYGSNPTQLGIYGDKGRQFPIIFSKNLPTPLTASGKAVAFPGGLYHSTNSIIVTYRTQFVGTVSGGNYTEIDDGVAVEAIAYGAASRIAASKESPRVLLDDQGYGQTSGEAGDRIALATFLENKYRMVLNHWHEMLWSESAPMGSLY